MFKTVFSVTDILYKYAEVFLPGYPFMTTSRSLSYEQTLENSSLFHPIINDEDKKSFITSKPEQRFRRNFRSFNVDSNFHTRSSFKRSQIDDHLVTNSVHSFFFVSDAKSNVCE